MQMEFALARPEDAEELLALQREAFQEHAALYDDVTIPPMTETPDDIRAAMAREVILKGEHEGRIIVTGRAALDGATCHLGRLAVEPAFQGRGLGTQLMAALEAVFPQVERFQLHTGDRCEGNIRLYERLGYRIFKRERQTPKVMLVHMEKVRG